MRRSSRQGWIALAAAVALTALMAPAAAVSQPHQVRPARAKRPGNGFSPAGPWNARLPAKVPLAPNSAAIAAEPTTGTPPQLRQARRTSVLTPGLLEPPARLAGRTAMGVVLVTY